MVNMNILNFIGYFLIIFGAVIIGFNYEVLILAFGAPGSMQQASSNNALVGAVIIVAGVIALKNQEINE